MFLAHQFLWVMDQSVTLSLSLPALSTSPNWMPCLCIGSPNINESFMPGVWSLTSINRRAARPTPPRRGEARRAYWSGCHSLRRGQHSHSLRLGTGFKFTSPVCQTTRPISAPICMATDAQLQQWIVCSFNFRDEGLDYNFPNQGYFPQGYFLYMVEGGNASWQTLAL